MRSTLRFSITISIFCAGFFIAIGLFVAVRAVAPGAVQNPSFGPLDGNVSSDPVDQASCYWTPPTCGWAVCPQDYIVVGTHLKFNEACFGAANDFDSPNYEVRCCKIL